MAMGFLSILGTFSPLLAAALHMHTLSSGVKVWLQENTQPPHMVAFRVIEDEQKYGLDAFWGDAAEVDGFFTSIKQEATAPIEVIAVGDFEEKTLLTWMENTLSDAPPLNQNNDLSGYNLSENEDRPPITVSLSYPMMIAPIRDEDSLKQFWCAAVCRKLIEKRCEESLATVEATWDGAGESLFFPQKSCGGKAHCDPDDSAVVLIKFMSAIQEIRRTGFTVSEWEDAKTDMIKAVQTNLRLPADSSSLATYFSEQIAVGATLWPAYPFFVSSSIKALQEIDRPMAHQTVMAVLKDKERRTKYTGPYIFDEADIQEVLNEHNADHLEIPLVEEKPMQVHDEIALAPFILVPVTETEEKLIWELIDNLGNKGYLGLLGVKARMNEIEEKIKHIHPLRFLGSIYADPYLKECMPKAFKKSIVKNRFINELRDKFLIEFQYNNVYPLIPGFCKKVGADPDEVSLFIQQHQWEKLLRYLSRL